jgi:hypothetical protein
MSYKLLPRLGSAIASTILSLFSGVLLVGVDKAQAAVLTFNFDAGRGDSNLNYFKVDTSLLTGIGLENIAVSEGRFYSYTLSGGKEYYNLAGKSALFQQGVFRSLDAGEAEDVIRELIIPADQPGGPYYVKVDSRMNWHIRPFQTGINTWGSALNGYYEQITTYNNLYLSLTGREIFNDRPVDYTLVNTEAEPVPEPLTVGGTALALAGLSWLKQKKKMAA